MYRRTRKYQARHKPPRPDIPPEDQRPATWQPPHLRRRITIEDFDGPEPRTHTIELFRTRRIDSYRAVVNGEEWHASIGWSRVLDGVRRSLPRLLSPRHQDV
ncbi:hypothetical protein CS053_08200 [Rhodanobacter glycinis]|uniref:Uncharacterized protein n=1 Tax=Rhodanobacter glycinis TaxID=582702 RepID=A0A5B9E1D8_9GAMM|nr:hypothetical protein [Rhodanobacter glycinis]QEE24481.1 hypothetical protein CS053_08200 [Rhodanobacter glycinis]